MSDTPPDNVVALPTKTAPPPPVKQKVPASFVKLNPNKPPKSFPFEVDEYPNFVKNFTDLVTFLKDRQQDIRSFIMLIDVDNTNNPNIPADSLPPSTNYIFVSPIKRNDLAYQAMVLNQYAARVITGP